MSEQLSKHFHSRELACKCGCGLGDRLDDYAFELIVLLEQIRDSLETPLHINSGARCAAHNSKVGGVADSLHTPHTVRTRPKPVVMAADIAATGTAKYDIAATALMVGASGVGVGGNFVHVDVRDVIGRPRAIWGYAAGGAGGSATEKGE